jgi:glycosyltransferase involved in cell wall biosynthesis
MRHYHQLKIDLTFDVILSQKCLEQYPIFKQISDQLNIPLIVLHHSLPWIPPFGNWNEETTKRIGHLQCDHNVFVSNFSAEAWYHDPNDPNIMILHHGIDTNFFSNWIGGDGKVMTAVQNYPQRDNIYGFSLYKAATKDLKTNAWGNSPGFSKNANGPDHLLELYKKASVFLNTTQWSSCPLAILEAMSVGCPVVSTCTTMLPEFLIDGENCFLSNDPKVMHERLKQLIDDPILGKKLGAAGRETIIQKFGQERFLQEWNQIFHKVVQCPRRLCAI